MEFGRDSADTSLNRRVDGILRVILPMYRLGSDMQRGFART